MKPPGLQPDLGARGDDLQTARLEPIDLLYHVVDRPRLQSNQDVQHLRQIDGADSRPIDRVAQQRLNLGRGRLTGERSNDRLGVKQCQRGLPFRASAAASASRSSARISSLVGARPDREPIAAPIGSAGIGRITRAFP
jgi:hypothetical protein